MKLGGSGERKNRGEKNYYSEDRKKFIKYLPVLPETILQSALKTCFSGEEFDTLIGEWTLMYAANWGWWFRIKNFRDVIDIHEFN